MLKDLWFANMNYTARDEKSDDGTDVRRFKGVASTSILDRQDTYVDQKSLSKAAKLYDKRNGKVFYNHTWAVPIGRRESVAHESEKLYLAGLVGRGFPVPVVVPNNPMAGAVVLNVDDIWEIMKQDLATSLSIGFRADLVEGKLDKETGRRGPPTLMVKDLLEVSVVTIPANPDAEFTVTRAMDDDVFMALRGERIIRATREEVWGLDLDGSAVAAAVGSTEDFREDDETYEEAMDLLSDNASEWASVREEVEAWRKSLRR